MQIDFAEIVSELTSGDNILTVAIAGISIVLIVAIWSHSQTQVMKLLFKNANIVGKLATYGVACIAVVTIESGPVQSIIAIPAIFVGLWLLGDQIVEQMKYGRQEN